MIRSIFLVSSLALAAACAKNPDAIAPVSMGNAFEGISCRNAQQMLLSENESLAALSATQKQAVTGDAVGVFLIGVPVSSLSGNNVEGSIAATKGKIVALENRLLRC